MKMNLPNKLTCLRMILVPVFVAILLIFPNRFEMRLLADAVFILASLTDLLDGKIARKYNLVTNFGKFMDPLADKLLVCSAMICLVALHQLPAWICIIIIGREFIISGFRLVAANNGIVIAASYWGKFKTTFQMLMVIVMVANITVEPFDKMFSILSMLLMWTALILTVVSLVDYLAKNIDVLKEQS
ncbi:CDP-diacylglycerol--glycerol-3-phosphate 3-phosphatidyltransferase [Lachnospiraceae bacterium KHCPX20]|nr:CDP-diacylglycerol--glycerol-3-phosphate 3-phosphatidyltransferase [Lachnospiraceae bacterium KHCPX20]